MEARNGAAAPRSFLRNSSNSCVLIHFQGSEIIKGHSPHLSRSKSSISDIEDASDRTRTTTINGACSRYFHDATEGRYRKRHAHSKHGTLTHFFSQQCRLQMCPPGLPFTRVIRFSVDVAIRFTPRATGQEIYTPQGHIFLLTDLFLVCERMPNAERAACGPDDPDMYLSYPPLAGKHLRVTEVAGPPGGKCTVSIVGLEFTPLCCSQNTSSRLSS